MSNPVPSTPTPIVEFQAQFGAQPGSLDAVAECKKWEKLCGELLEEREKLRKEVAQTRREYDACAATLFRLTCKDAKADINRELAFAHIDDKPTVEELIAELHNASEK